MSKQGKNSGTVSIREQSTMKGFLKNINFKMLKGQKTQIILLQAKLEKPKAKFTQKDIDALEGLINLIDEVQRIAVDEFDYPERTVFRRTRKDE